MLSDIALKLSSCPLNPNFLSVFRIILTRACLEQTWLPAFYNNERWITVMPSWRYSIWHNSKLEQARYHSGSRWYWVKGPEMGLSSFNQLLYTTNAKISVIVLVLIGSTVPCAEMCQCINASLQRIRVNVSSLQTIRRKRRPWWARRTQMDKYSEKHRLLDSKNSIRLCRGFQKVKKSFFIIFWRLYIFQCSFAHWLRRCMEISVFLFPSVTCCVIVHGNFRVTFLLSAKRYMKMSMFISLFYGASRYMVISMFLFHVICVRVHGNFHVPFGVYV